MFDKKHNRSHLAGIDLFSGLSGLILRVKQETITFWSAPIKFSPLDSLSEINVSLCKVLILMRNWWTQNYDIIGH